MTSVLTTILKMQLFKMISIFDVSIECKGQPLNYHFLTSSFIFDYLMSALPQGPCNLPTLFQVIRTVHTQSDCIV